jgi:aspartate aminotransferase
MQKVNPQVISLAGGEPDFDTPKRICEEAYRQMMAGNTHYTSGTGIPELREAVAKKLRDENQCFYSADDIVVTPGGKFAIYLAVRTVVNPGDEVIYLEPGWVSYPSIVEASGGVPVPVRLKFSDGFELRRELLEEKVTERTKMLIINYPNNPTGKVLSRKEADVLADFMRSHPDILLLADEIYERIVYTGYETVSMASYPDLKERVLTVNGFSKSCAMTGWRLGYVAATEKIRKVMTKLYQHTLSCVSGFIQKAAVVALDCQDEIEEMRRRYEIRRDFFVGGLNAIPGVECMYPEGAFYAWVKFDLPGLDSEGVCNYLLNEAFVVGVPGDAYGSDEVCVRFSFAAADEELKRAVVQIRDAVEKYQENLK